MFGLSYITAALNLYREVRLPEPWIPAEGAIPLIIYGVRAFAVKLARLSNIHPNLSYRGARNQVCRIASYSSKGDAVIDYRKGPDFVTAELQRLAPEIEYALDAISTPDTVSIMVPAVDPANGRLSLVLPQELPPQAALGIKTTVAFAPALWEPSDCGKETSAFGNICNFPLSLMPWQFRYL